MTNFRERKARWISALLAIVLISACSTSEFNWQVSFSGANDEPRSDVTDIVTDTQGNSYFTGYVANGLNLPNRRWVVVKYDSLGNESWRTRIDGALEYGEAQPGQGEQLAATADGVISLGILKVPDGSNYSLAVTKILEDGSQAWRYQLPFTMIQRTMRVTDDGIYVAGVEYQSEAVRVLHYLKLSLDGSELWAMQEEFAESSLATIEVDSLGNSYLITLASEESAIYSFNDNGDQLWKNTYSAEGASLEIADTALAENDGLYFIASRTPENSSASVAVVYKLDIQGNAVWQTSINTPLVIAEYGNYIRVNGGNVYAVSNFGRLPPDGDVVLSALDSATGTKQWERNFNGGVQSLDTAQSFSLDSQGNPVLMVNTLTYLPAVGGYTTRIHRTNADGSAGVTHTLGTFKGAGFALGPDDEVNATGIDVVPLSNDPGVIQTTQFGAL